MKSTHGRSRSNVRQWIAAGLGGIVALGTNGEAALLDDDESVRVVEATRLEVPRDRDLIVGAGHESTRATIAAAKTLASAGADAVLVKTPHTYRNHVAPRGLIAHYTAVADASPVPVLLYNFPASTGVNLSPETVERLAAHPNIVGMKETSTDGAQFADLGAAVPADFTILCGAAPGVFAALCAGAKGAIVAVAGLMPRVMLDLRSLVEQGRYDEARALQHRITPLARAVTTGYGIRGTEGGDRSRRIHRRRSASAARAASGRRGRKDSSTAPCCPRLNVSSSVPVPARVSPRVMRAMSAPVLSHLDPEMVAILDDVRAHGLAASFRSSGGAFSFAVSGTGTSGMEAAVANLTRPGTRAIAVVSATSAIALRRSSSDTAPPSRASMPSGAGPAIRRNSRTALAGGRRSGHDGARGDVDRRAQPGRGRCARVAQPAAP